MSGGCQGIHSIKNIFSGRTFPFPYMHAMKTPSTDLVYGSNLQARLSLNSAVSDFGSVRSVRTIYA